MHICVSKDAAIVQLIVASVDVELSFSSPSLCCTVDCYCSLLIIN